MYSAQTTRIPILFSTGFDPVQLGLVASLNRPGGNLTGVNLLSGELGAKRIVCCCGHEHADAPSSL